MNLIHLVVAGSCEYGDKCSISTKGKGSLEYFSDLSSQQVLGSFLRSLVNLFNPYASVSQPKVYCGPVKDKQFLPWTVKIL